MILSPNKIIGSLIYRVREALRKDDAFLSGLDRYDYKPSLFHDGKFNFWHYPGTQNEISGTLITLGKGIDGGCDFKYPGLFNFNPVKQIKNGNDLTMLFNLAIVSPVLSEWLTQEREEQVFIPLLRPVYKELIRQIIISKYFILDFGIPKHEYYEVYTTGDTEGKLIERYGDHIDAIEIHNLALTLKNICDNQYRKIVEENDLVTENFK